MNFEAFFLCARSATLWPLIWVCLMSPLIFHCCCKRLPQIQLLDTHLLFLSSGGQESSTDVAGRSSRYQQATFLSRSSRGELFPAYLVSGRTWILRLLDCFLPAVKCGPFLFPRAAAFPGLRPTSSIFKASVARRRVWSPSPASLTQQEKALRF